MKVSEFDFEERLLASERYPVAFLQKYPADYGLEISCIPTVEVFGIIKVGGTSLAVYREGVISVPLGSGGELGPVLMLPVSEFTTHYGEWEKVEPEP